MARSGWSEALFSLYRFGAGSRVGVVDANFRDGVLAVTCYLCDAVGSSSPFFLVTWPCLLRLTGRHAAWVSG
jgi:hypothetical protein